ncbi:protein Mis18-beta [Scomber japonicus]|uniref:protein Mis18-beta n=1 Tax=Scomber japonicus TaxID=13676 RepID=UPI0023065990|nr:protein Mis18-beta [Scomber japonicus]
MEFNESLISERGDTDVKLTIMDECRPMTLHCEQCKTVLGDSLSICGEVKCLDSIMCRRVTNDVVLSDELESGHKGEMAKCIYSSLKCRGCHCAVGKVIHSAPSRLAVIRSIYLLHKANISCYILNSCSMVRASTLKFNLKPLKENIHEVKRQFQAKYDKMAVIKRRLEDSVATEADK